MIAFAYISLGLGLLAGAWLVVMLYEWQEPKRRRRLF